MTTTSTRVETTPETAPFLAKVAADLDALAPSVGVRSGEPAAATVRRLAELIGEGGGALAGRDLLAQFPPEAVIPDREYSPWRRAVGVVTVVRDALVFVPIALTWWRLYGALSDWHPAPGQSFLVAWRQGLTSTALAIALLIFVVILLTCVLPLLGRLADADASAASERRMFGEILARATLLLATPAASSSGPRGGEGASGIDPTTVAAQISWTAEQVVKEAHRVGERVEAALGTGTDQGLDALVRRFDDALVRWADLAATLEVAAEGLRAPAEVVDALAGIRSQAAEDERKLRAEVELLIGQLHNSSREQAADAHAHRLVAEYVLTSTSELAESLSVFHARTQSLGEFVDQLREYTAELETALRAVRGQ